MPISFTVTIDNISPSFEAIADSLIAYLQSKGMVVGVVEKCKFVTPTTQSLLLTEDSDYFLLESGYKIILE